MSLELKHLCAYLPYGLKVKNEAFRIDYVNKKYGILNGLYPLYKEGVTYYQYTTKDNSTGSSLNNCKPVLRPLSDLYKEITHNGNTFIPIEIFVEDYTNEIDFVEDNCVLWQDSDPHGTVDYSYTIDFIHDENESPLFFEVLTVCDKSNTNVMKYYNYLKLIEWHFDVYGLIDRGLAIDINTIKN